MLSLFSCFFYPSCILKFCHWHCKLFCHLAEQYSTDYFHVYACRKTDICSDNLLTSHIASWFFLLRMELDWAELLPFSISINGFWSLMHACITIMMWFLDFIFFFLRKNGDIIWVKWKLTCEFKKKKNQWNLCTGIWCIMS